MKFRFVFLVLLILVFSQNSFALENSKAVIYFNEVCAMCAPYLDNELIPALKELGVTEIVKKDYINDRLNRKEFNDVTEMYGIPLVMQGHFGIFVGGKVFLEGHVPIPIVVDLLKQENQSLFEKIVVFQDEMHGDAKSYKVWAFKGEIKEYGIDVPVSEYLGWFQRNKDSLVTPPDLVAKPSLEFLLPLIAVTGFIDGLNPCAFTVLLFLILFLFTIQRTRGRVFFVGGIYIAMIYLAYLLIGIGLLSAIQLSGQPHLLAKIGSIGVIILGLINIKDYFWFGKGVSLKMPSFSKQALDRWMHKATIPSAIVFGFLVGLCTFPCSGGPYVAILSLLSVTATFYEGLLYLLLYNVFFVLPLVIVLVVVSNKRVVGQIVRLEESKKRGLKLLMGIFMILLGIIILVFFV